MKNNLLIQAILVSIIINLLLPQMVKPFATPQQIKPPNGAENLSFPDQIMHMLVHHGQVPLTSSLIVALVVGLSICVAKKL